MARDESTALRKLLESVRNVETRPNPEDWNAWDDRAKFRERRRRARQMYPTLKPVNFCRNVGVGENLFAEHDGEKLVAWLKDEMGSFVAVPDGGVAFVDALGNGRCACISRNGGASLFRMEWLDFEMISSAERSVPSTFQAATLGQLNGKTTAVVAVRASGAIKLLYYVYSDARVYLKAETELEPPEDSTTVRCIAVHGADVILLWSTGLMEVWRDFSCKFKRNTQSGRVLSRAKLSAIEPIDHSYFAVLSAARLSFWDARFAIRHCYVDLKDTPMEELLRFGDTMVVEAEDGPILVDFELPELTLAAVASSADGRVAGMGDAYEAPPNGAMPVITGALAAAADAGTTHRFETFLQEAERSDLELCHAVASPAETPSADSLAERLTLGSLAKDNSSRFLSERLASASAARCAAEITRGRDEFATPLVSILETGAVSLAAVSSSYVSMPMNTTGATNPLDGLHRRNMAHVLHTLLRYVHDVSERDIVRMVALALSWRREDPGDEESSRLLNACLEVSIDTTKLVAALGLLPVRDVTELLVILDDNVFSTFFDHDTKQSDVLHGQSTGKITGVCERSLDWMSCAVEAHLASLILDDKAQEIMPRMLRKSKDAGAFCEAMGPVVGIIQHLIKDNDLPVAPTPAYTVENLSIL